MVDRDVVTPEEQVQCVIREIGQRRRVYGRWVEAGKMTAKKADFEIRAMEAVLATVQAAAKSARLI